MTLEESKMPSDKEKQLKRKQSSLTVVTTPENILTSSVALRCRKALAYMLRFFISIIPMSVRRYALKMRMKFFAKLLGARTGLKQAPDHSHSDYDILEKEVVTIDGTTLKTTHLFPHASARKHSHSTSSSPDETEDSTTGPCIIIRSPYYRYFGFAFAIHLVHNGYHVLLQDCRGRFESGGSFTAGENEKRDANCTLKWLSKQTWCNGDVGVFGVSMEGYLSWATFAASVEDDRSPITVKAIVPVVTSSNIIQYGMFMSEDTDRIDPVVRLITVARYSVMTHILDKPRKLLGSQLLWVVYKMISVMPKMQQRKWVKDVAMHLPLETIDIAATNEIPQPRVNFSSENEYFHTRDHSWAATHIGKSDTHATMISGWYDVFCRSSIQDFKKATSNSTGGDKVKPNVQLRIGDFSHFEDFFPITIRETVRTFNSAFKCGTERHEEDAKRVRLICLGADGFFFTKQPIWQRLMAAIWPSHSIYSTTNEQHHAWRSFDHFPPKEAVTGYLALAPGGKLFPTSADRVTWASDDNFDSYVYDPDSPTPTSGGALFDIDEAGIVEQTSLMNRKDVLVYQTRELSETIEIAGDVYLDTLISSSAVSMDVFAKLCVTLPSGDTYNLCEGIERVTLGPGENWPKNVRVLVGPICAQFGPGSKICLLVSSGSFPQCSRNLGYGEASHKATAMTSARQRIFWGASRLNLPVTVGRLPSSLSTHTDTDSLLYDTL